MQFREGGLHQLGLKAFSEADKLYSTKPKWLPEHDRILREAKKYGGMTDEGVFTAGVFPYFKHDAFPPIRDHSGGHIDFTQGVSLQAFRGAVVQLPIDDKSEQFLFRILDSNAANVDLCLESGFLLLSRQAEMWQHFMQDALHYLFFAKDFLRENGQIPLLIFGPYDPSVIWMIKSVLGLTNPLIRLRPPEAPPQQGLTIRFDFLFLSSFFPKSHLYSCAPEMRRIVNRFLAKPDDIKNKIVYLSRRNQNTRRVGNENDLVRLLEIFAKKSRLEFIYWDSNKYSFEQTTRFMQQAKLVVAPHGGANYHVYWSSPGTRFVEIVFPQEMETLMPIACSIGLDYWLLPCEEAGHTTSEVNVDIEALRKIIEYPDADFKFCLPVQNQSTTALDL